MTNTTKMISLVLLSVAACKGKQAAPAADPSPTAKPTEPAAAVAPAAATAPAGSSACTEKGPVKIDLAAGESIMKDRTKGTEQIMVKVQDTGVTLALVEKKGGEDMLMQLRAFTACGATNLNAWMPKGVAGVSLAAQKDGALLANSTFAESDGTSAPKGVMNYRQIRLESGTAKITKTWDCDDSKKEDSCESAPDWIIEGAIEGAPESPEG